MGSTCYNKIKKCYKSNMFDLNILSMHFVHFLNINTRALKNGTFTCFIPNIKVEGMVAK